MNKKGFTLIELLAVIVILAIIMVIAVPQILNVVQSSKNSAWKSNVKLIEEIQNADLSQQMHGNFEFIESKDVTESYKCMYQIQSGEIELCHIFSDYSSIMEK